MWAPVTGYASQAFGATQLESIDDGDPHRQRRPARSSRHALDVLTGKKKQGGNVVTTLNAAAQKAALQGRSATKKGAVVAIDPETGAILALASHPSYDPSAFAGNSTRTARPGRSSRRTRTSRCSTGRCARPTRRAPPSRSSPPPRRWRTGCTTGHRREDRLPAAVHAAGHPTGCRTRATSPARTPRCGRRCSTPATPSSARSAPTSARTRCGRGGEVRLQRGELGRPVRATRASTPEHGQAADRADRHRPVRASTAHPAADGHGGLGHRQRRQADAAVHGRQAAGARTWPTLETDQPEEIEPGRLSRRRARSSQADDGDRRQGGHRHNAPRSPASPSAARPVPPSTA